MTSKTNNMQPLRIKDCEILHIATGVRAQNLRELRDTLASIHPESISYHFWAKKLRPTFEEPEYNNDFATWAYSNLHDNKLAERLSLINPGEFSDSEGLRGKIINVLDLRLEENNSVANSKQNEKFQFTQSQNILFDTDIVVNKPEELSDLIGDLPLGSIYFHFVDPNNTSDNLASWISEFGDDYKGLVEKLTDLDPYFFTLTDLRTRISHIVKDCFKGASS